MECSNDSTTVAHGYRSASLPARARSQGIPGTKTRTDCCGYYKVEGLLLRKQWYHLE